MGCTESRETDGQQIELMEASIKLTNFKIGQIKEAFFQATGSGTITGGQIEKSLKHLGIEYNLEERILFNRFLSAFYSFEDEGIIHYDVTRLLTALFVLSKSSRTEKASALFDLYDANYSNTLSRLEIETAFCRICEVVFQFSEKILENDESMISMHEEIMQQKREEVLKKTNQYFFSSKVELTREKFLEMITVLADSEDVVDFTSTTSIRERCMDFLFKGRLTQVQLQQHYSVGKYSKTSKIFEKDENLSDTIDCSPRSTSSELSIKK